MPPRRSARVAAVAERESSALAPLPHALALHIFALLPVDARLRCREVCRGWRAVLFERSLWLRLDLSKASGGLARPATDALLRAGSAPAGGQLQWINVAECRAVTHEALLAVVTANAGALRKLCLRLVRFLELADAESLLRAAPQLRVLDADVACESVVDAQRLLRNEGVFAPLRLRGLEVVYDTQTEAAMLSLAADLAAHVGLKELHLYGAPLDTPAALDALVAAVLANPFSRLTLGRCSLSPASVPALARLLGGGVLRSLWILNDERPLLDAAAAVVLGDALRAGRSLDSLMLVATDLWHNPEVAVMLLGAITRTAACVR
jgi:hypothetical protein